MALSSFIRGTSAKLRVSSLQSLSRSPFLPCSSIIGSSHFHHSLISQRTMDTQRIQSFTPKLSAVRMQSATQFSLSSRNMSSHGDHSKLWTIERGVAIAMLGLVPVAIVASSSTLDYILVTLVVVHNHWGFEAVIVDYVRPILFGPAIPKIALAALYTMSAVTLAGLYMFIFNDVGISNALKMLWKL